MAFLLSPFSIGYSVSCVRTFLWPGECFVFPHDTLRGVTISANDGACVVLPHGFCSKWTFQSTLS